MRERYEEVTPTARLFPRLAKTELSAVIWVTVIVVGLKWLGLQVSSLYGDV
ncbi:MAG: hypothetical protein J6386_04920 [Candidatus Synoicihabitans palmerolidicus]|nr:hypothetical protein [Candidatus Synoicihabitans palmerolidicus]